MIDWNDPQNEPMLLLALLNRDHQGNWEEIAKILGPDFTTHGVRYAFLPYLTHSTTILDSQQKQRDLAQQTVC